MASQLKSEYKCYEDKSHFFSDRDVTDIIRDIIGKVRVP